MLINLYKNKCSNFINEIVYLLSEKNYNIRAHTNLKLYGTLNLRYQVIYEFKFPDEWSFSIIITENECKLSYYNCEIPINDEFQDKIDFQNQIIGRE